jgi:hypothetical protein
MGQSASTIATAVGKMSASDRSRARSPVVKLIKTQENDGSDVTSCDVRVKSQ